MNGDAKAGLIPRCVTVPLGDCLGRVAPKGRDPFAPAEPAEFWPVIHTAWRLATDTANAAVQELARRDVRRLPGGGKFPPMPAVNLYTEWLNEKAPAEFREAFRDFEGAKGSAADILQSVHKAWVRQRFDVLHRGESWPLAYRYPYPWPVRKQEWRLKWDKDAGFALSVTLPGGRYVYSLRTGPEFRRQERELHAILAGEAKAGSLRLCPHRKDGHTVGVFVRLSGFFRPADKAGTNAAAVRTDPNAFLVVEVSGRPPWILDADHLRRAFAIIRTEQARHKVRLQRMSEDGKREKRQDRRQRYHLDRRRGQFCEKHAKRMDTAIHQLAAQTVRFLVRQGCAVVAYDDAVKSFLPDGFPWHRFGATLRHKCESAGMEWIGTPPASGGAVDETPGSARMNEGGDGTGTCATATRSRNGRPGHRAGTRSRNAANTGPGERLEPAAPGSLNRAVG